MEPWSKSLKRVTPSDAVPVLRLGYPSELCTVFMPWYLVQIAPWTSWTPAAGLVDRPCASSA